MRPITLALFAVTVAIAAAVPSDCFSQDGRSYTRRERRDAQRMVLRLLDHAVDSGHLTPLQRLRVAVLVRFDAGRCCELLESAVPEAARLDGQDPRLYGAEDDGSGRLRSEGGLYRLDIDKLDQFFQLLLKYLPQFIEMIKTLFPESVAMLSVPTVFVA